MKGKLSERLSKININLNELERELKESAERVAGEMKTTMPHYYHKGGIDVIGFMETKVNKDEMRGFFRGNVLKYVTRFHEKNGVDDLRKAKYYLDRLIELEETNE